MKTKESIKAYNREYFARPEVIARAKIRNIKYRKRRSLYKKTKRGKEADKKYRDNAKSWRRPERENYRLTSLYGITLVDYNNLVIKQHNKCAICDSSDKGKLHVDHCHETNKVRGLLCGSCNRALGLMKDNTEFLLKAIKYLQ